jgi:hypothetical protein
VRIQCGQCDSVLGAGSLRLCVKSSRMNEVISAGFLAPWSWALSSALTEYLLSVSIVEGLGQQR